MRIGIDVRAALGKKAGKGEYVYNLIKTFAKIDSHNRFILYTNRDFNFNLPYNFKKQIVKLPSILWHLNVLYRLWFKDKTDVFLATTSLIIPALGFKRCVTVIFDLVSFLKIAKHQKKAALVEKLTLKRALNKSKKIIAISQNTKQDIIKLFHMTSDKIEVIPLAANPRFRIIKDIRMIYPVLKKYKLPSHFLLFVGTLEPRKNIVRLIEAYYQLIRRKKELRNISLVIAGQKGWYYEEIFETVKKLNLQNNILFLDYVPDKDLPYLYNSALSFIFPSLYEGFGIIILEAMACGVPVIASKTSSLPEVGGDAALYINPYNVNDISQTMEKVILDSGLRKQMVKKGLRQIRNFYWEKTASQTLKVIKSLNL